MLLMRHLVKSKKKCPKRVKIVEAIVSAKNGILLLRRSKNNDLYVGNWQLPGGKVNSSESPAQAIKREVHEEMGCECAKMKFLKKIVFSDFYRGNDSEVVLYVFSCKLSGSISLSKDHSNARFVKKSALKKYKLAPVSKKSLFS